MKINRHSWPWGLLTLTLAFHIPVFSPVYGESNLSLTLEPDYARVLTGNATIGHNNGMGAQALLEFSPVEYFSLGVQSGFLYYWGIVTPNPTWSGSLDGVLRLTPWGVLNNGLSSYLILGGGINDLSSGHSAWQGDYHFMGGLGIRYYFDPQWALDVGASYNYYTPTAAPLQTLNGHLGISFFFNQVSGAQRPEETSGYTPGSLQAIAAKEYGDPDLYPILIDTNFKDKSRGFVLPPGTQLVIPRDLTPAMMRQAHLQARTSQYQDWAASFNNPQISAAYLEQEKPKPPHPTAQKEYLLAPSDSLWDVAAKVYGDPELYPLLVDANRNLLKNSSFSQKIRLIVPRHLSEDQIRLTRIKAWSVNYLLLLNKTVTKEDYRQWRKTHGLPVREEPEN